MLSVDRPVISDLKRSGVDLALELFAFAILTISWATTLHHYPRLPRSIPRHFNVSGEPDVWGNKSNAFLLPIVSLALYAALTVLNRFPHRFNYPWPITESNARSQYALARQLLTAIKVAAGTIFAYSNWAQIETALGTRPGLGAWFLPTAVSVTLLIIVIYFFRGRRMMGPAQPSKRIVL